MKVIIYLLVFSVSVYLLFEFNVKYSMSDLKGYTTTLFGVSSMVFTIMGIWLAFLYPRAMANIVEDGVETSQSIAETKRVEKIVLSVLKSAVVVTILMLLYLLHVIFSKTSIYALFSYGIETTVLSIVILLSFIQIESVLYVIKSNIDFIVRLHEERERKETINDI